MQRGKLVLSFLRVGGRQAAPHYSPPTSENVAWMGTCVGADRNSKRWWSPKQESVADVNIAVPPRRALCAHISLLLCSFHFLQWRQILANLCNGRDGTVAIVQVAWLPGFLELEVLCALAETEHSFHACLVPKAWVLMNELWHLGTLCLRAHLLEEEERKVATEEVLFAIHCSDFPLLD